MADTVMRTYHPSCLDLHAYAQRTRVAEWKATQKRSGEREEGCNTQSLYPPRRAGRMSRTADAKRPR